MARNRKNKRRRSPQDQSAQQQTGQRAPKCATCDATLVPGEKFCRECGSPVQPSSVQKTDSKTGDTAKQGTAPPTATKTSQGSAEKETSQPVPGGARRPSWQALVAIGGVVILVGVAAAIVVGSRSETGGSTASDGDLEAKLASIENASPTATTTETQSSDEVSNGKLPAQSRGEMGRSIKAVIRKHHQYIADGDYQAAFALMSRRKQERPLYDTPSCQDASCWGATMGPLTSGLTQPVEPSVKIVRLFKDDGVAEIRVSLPMPSCPTGAWEGITWARYERNKWTYDPGWKTNEPQRSRYDGPGDSQDPRLLGVGCDT